MEYDITILLKAVANDDEKAFRVIFDYYKVPFYSSAFKMTRSESVAEDIIQEVFITLWVKRKLIAGAKNPEAYVFGVLRNCIYAQFKNIAKERQFRLRFNDHSDEADSCTEMLLIQKEDQQLLEACINELPAKQKIVYLLAKQENLSRDEIAQQLNLSPNTVRNHLSAAIEHLRTHLKKCVSAILCAVIWLNL